MHSVFLCVAQDFVTLIYFVSFTNLKLIDIQKTLNVLSSLNQGNKMGYFQLYSKIVNKCQRGLLECDIPHPNILAAQ